MKIALTDPAGFADTVGWVARHLPNRPSIPVLATVLLDATEDGRLTVSAFDYEVAVVAEVDGVQVDRPGRVAVGGAMLAQLAGSVRPTDVEFDGSRLNLAAKRTKASLQTVPLDDRPQLPDPLPQTVKVPAGRLAQAINTLTPLSADPGNQPALAGVRFESDGAGLNLYATDRFRIGWHTLAGKEREGQLAAPVTIPAGPLLATVKGWRGDDPVELGTDGNSLTLHHRDRVSTIRAIAEPFPAGLERLFNPGPDKVTVDTAELREAIRQANSVAFALEISTGDFGLQLVAIDGGRERLADWQGVVPCELDGTGGSFRINSHYLATCLDLAASGGAETVSIRFTSNAQKPVRLGDGARLAVAMPLRTN